MKSGKSWIKKPGGSKGQVTIFVILTALIAVSIIIFVILNQTTPKSTSKQKINPAQEIRLCAKQVIEKTSQELLQNGGTLNLKNFATYQNQKYRYLCYSWARYKPCYNIHPMLIPSAEKEIKEATKPKIQECFNKLKEELEKQNYKVDGEETIYDLKAYPGLIKTKLRKKITLSKDQATQTIENFDTNLVSPLYDILDLTSAIVAGESRYCSFEYIGYMILHPQYNIKKIYYNDTKFYEINYENTNYKIKFAVRSCVKPHGLL